MVAIGKSTGITDYQKNLKSLFSSSFLYSGAQFHISFFFSLVIDKVARKYYRDLTDAGSNPSIRGGEKHVCLREKIINTDDEGTSRNLKLWQIDESGMSNHRTIHIFSYIQTTKLALALASLHL